MELLSLLEVQQEKQSVGTLVLGETNSFREIFFETDHVYLCGEPFSGRFDMSGLTSAGVLGTRLSLKELEAILAGCNLTKELLSSVLLNQALIDEKQARKLVPREIREEILNLLCRNGDSFHFQEKRVPERLLQLKDVTVRTPIRLDDLITKLKKRLEEMRIYRHILPSEEEVFVMTAEGMAHMQQHSEDFGLQRLFGLIDGFRNVRSLADCSRYYEPYLLRLLTEALEREFLKKTVLPDIRGIRLEGLTDSEARSCLPRFKEAVRHAVDPIDVRARLAEIYRKLGDIEEAVVQYNFVGDALFGMKKPAAAVEAYRKALEIKPGNVMVTDKITRIYEDAAEQELLKGNRRHAVQLLESALYNRPDDSKVFHRLVEILTNDGKIDELTDLCDRIVAYAKRVGNPQIGVAACHQVLAKSPDSPLFHKKLVNVYLDFGDLGNAALEMARLAKIYLEKGQIERSRDLAEKIKRLKGKNPDVARIHRGLARDLHMQKGKRSYNKVLVALVLGLLIVFGVYQLLSYDAWRDIQRTAVAYAQTSGQSLPHEMGVSDFSESGSPSATGWDGGVGGLRPGLYEKHSLFLASRCEKFLRDFPLTIFRAKAAALARRHRLQASQLSRRRRDHKQKLLDEASLAAAEGDQQALRATLAPLLGIKDKADPWRIQAVEMLKDIDTSERSAVELFEAARSLEDAGQWRGANAMYRKLLASFPKSRLVEGLTLPVVVESVPSGADLYRVETPAKRTLLGQTPAVLRLGVEEIVEVELAHRGYHPLKSDVYEARGDHLRLVLEREAGSILEFSGSVPVLPVFDGRRVVVAGDSGTVQAIDIESGEVTWSVSRAAINRVHGPPLVTPEGIYLVWNDRQVFLVDRGSSTAAAARIKARATLKELARTAAVILDDGSFVVGTRSALCLLHRGSLKRSGEMLLRAAVDPDDVPVTLAKLDRNSVVVATARGKLVAMEVPENRILWSKRLAGIPAIPPTRVGPALVTFTSERYLLILDPESGAPRHLQPLPEGVRVAVDPLEGGLLTIDGGGTIRSLSLTNGRVLKEETLELSAPVNLVGLGGQAAVLHGDEGRRVVVVDSVTFEPLWATRSEEPIQMIVSSPEDVLAVTRAADETSAISTRLVVYSRLASSGPTREIMKTWKEAEPPPGRGEKSAPGEPRDDSR